VRPPERTELPDEMVSLDIVAVSVERAVGDKLFFHLDSEAAVWMKDPLCRFVSPAELTPSLEPSWPSRSSFDKLDPSEKRFTPVFCTIE